jgi:hypothetical protein
MKTKLTIVLLGLALACLAACTTGTNTSSTNTPTVNNTSSSPTATSTPDETAQIPASFAEFVDTKQGSTPRKDGGRVEERRVGERTEKVVTWPDNWFVGDCTMHGGATATFRSDGTGTFSARVRSTDDDDEWKMEIVVRRGDGSFLFRLPPSPPGWITWYSKKMPDDDTDYGWSFNFSFAPEFYNSIGSAQLGASC